MYEVKMRARIVALAMMMIIPVSMVGRRFAALVFGVQISDFRLVLLRLWRCHWSRVNGHWSWCYGAVVCLVCGEWGPSIQMNLPTLRWFVAVVLYLPNMFLI